MVTLSQITTFLTLISKAIGTDSLHRLLDQIEAERHGLELPQIPGIESADELIAGAGDLPPMLVERLLPDNSLFLLTGKPKTGKSFLALDIADCVSCGASVMGELKVNRPGPVLYLAMEDGKAEIARRLSQRQQTTASQAHQVSDQISKSLYFIAEAFSLTDTLHYARFREKAEALAPSLIIIDTAAEALDIRDWINRSEILTKIAPIRRLAREICTVLLVAHNRKAEGDGGDEIAGSNALAGAVDGWISAHKVERRPNGNRRLHLRVEGRGGVGHALIAEMNHDTLHFHLIPQEEVALEIASDRQALRAAKYQERRALALDVMRRRPEGATIAELAASLGIAYSVAWPLMRELVASGGIEEIGTKESNGGRPSPIYRLNQT